MFQSKKLKKLQQELSSSSSVLVLLPSDPNPDLQVASLALYTSLKKADKNTQIGCSSPIDSPLPNADQIKQYIGSRNLIVTFPYQPDSVEHVSYDINKKQSTFNLRIKPAENGQPLDPQQVDFSFSGAQADLVLTLGIKSLPELGRLYSDEKDFLDSSTIFNIHYFPQNFDFATVDLRTQATSLSEAISYLIKKLNLSLTPSLSTPLYQCLLDNTNQFKSPQITPQTFKTAAFLLENGAQPGQPSPSRQAPFFKSPASPPPPSSEPKTAPPSSSSSPPEPIPSDWQKPKIYRSDSQQN